MNGPPGECLVRLEIQGDQLVRRRYDVSRRAIVLDQREASGCVVFLEPTEELHIASAPLVNVLVVIAHREDGQLAIGLCLSPASDCRNEAILRFVDVLVLVNQDVAESCK